MCVECNSMRISAIIVLGFLYVLILKGQNYIPNGDFELYSECPTDISQTEKLLFWQNPSERATPDYYNECVDSMCGVGVPLSYWGSEIYASSGRGFVGCAFGVLEPEYVDLYKEYVYVRLDSLLVEGKEYTLEVDLRRPPSTTLGVSFQAHLSNSRFKQKNNDNLDLSPNLMTTPPIDHLDWQRYSSTYIAEGDERYLIIGNFESDSLLWFNMERGLNKIQDSCKRYFLDSTMYLLIDNICLAESKSSNIKAVRDSIAVQLIQLNESQITISMVDGRSDNIPYRLEIWTNSGKRILENDTYSLGDIVTLNEVTARQVYYATLYRQGATRTFKFVMR